MPKLPVVHNVSTQLRDAEADRKERVKLRAETVATWPRWRQFVYELVRGAPFEWIVFLLIIVNSIAVSTQNINSLAPYSHIFQRLEEICTVFFVLEMILKMIGLGVFVRKISFFSSWWNVADFIITAVSMGALIGTWSGSLGNVGIGFARSFRILRPLRFLSALGSLRVVLRSSAASLSRLGNVFLLSVAFLTFMSLAGLQFFSHAVSNSCQEVWAANLSGSSNGSWLLVPPLLAIPPGARQPFASVRDLEAAASSSFTAPGNVTFAMLVPPFGAAQGCAQSSTAATNPLLLAEASRLLAQQQDNFSPSSLASAANNSVSSVTPSGILQNGIPAYQNALESGLVVLYPSQLPTESRGLVCRYGQYCLATDSDNPSQYGFRDVLSTVVLLYTVVSLDSWSSGMSFVMDSKGGQAQIYFSVLVIIGTIFILNLALAIISDSFSRQMKFESSFLRKQKRIERKNGIFVEGDSVLSPAGAATTTDGISDRATIMDLESTVRSVAGGVVGDSSAPPLAALDESARTLQEVPSHGTWTGMFMTPGLLLRATPAPSSLATWVKYLRKKAAERVFASPLWDLLMNLCALSNGIVLATAHAGMSDNQASAVRRVNNVFTLVFALDFIFQFAALGPRQYFGLDDALDLSRSFDASVVAASLLEYFVGGGGTVFGSLRILRLSKWFRYFPSIQSSVHRLFTSLRATLSLILFTVIMTYIFALMGTVLFAGSMCGLDTTSSNRVNTSVCDDVPRANFDNIGYSLLTVFSILSGDGWKTIMLNEMRGTGNPYASIYFCLCYLVMGYLVVNLFVAILIANFSTQGPSKDDMDEDGDGEEAVIRQEQALVLSASRSLFSMKATAVTRGSPRKGGRRGSAGCSITSSNSQALLQVPLLRGGQSSALVGQPGATADALPGGALFIDGSLLDSKGQLPPLDMQEMVSVGSTDDDDDEGGDGSSLASRSPSVNSEEILQGFDIIHTKSDVGASFAQRRKEVLDRIKFEEGHRSTGRFIAGSIVKSRRFKAVYVVVILFSSATVAVSDPLDYPDSRLSAFQRASDVVLCVMFSLEAALKIWYLGVHHPKGLVLKGYFNYRWNIFDFVLTLCTVPTCLSFVASGEPALQEIVAWCRVTRCLRPLSFIASSESLMLVFQSLLAAIPRIRNVGVVLFLVWFMYAVMGVQLFAGWFSACSSGSGDDWGDISFRGPFITDRINCELANYTWLPAPRNFDTFGNALLTMFQVATVDNWQDIMFLGVDSSGPNTAPIPRNRPYVYLYFVSFVVFVTYFLLQVFVSVMVDAYFTTKALVEIQRRHTLLHNHEATLEPAQEDFLSMYRRALFFVKPPLNTVGRTKFLAENAVYRLLVAQFRRILRVRYFEALYLAVVSLHIVVMATQYMEAPPFDFVDLMIVDLVFNMFFVGVGTVRVVVVGWRAYFMSTRNKLEFSINTVTVLSCIARVAMHLQHQGSRAEQGDGVASVDLLRSTRVFRLFRIIYMSTNMRLLVATVMHSAPKFFVLAFFVLEIFFIYASVGMKVFGRVKFQDTIDRAYIGKYANFAQFGSALMVLLRTATLDDWTELMESCAITEKYGHCEDRLGDCGKPGAAQLFFMSFVVFGQWLALNFFTAEVMDSFSCSEREDRYVIQRRDVQRFQQLWKSFCHPTTELMNVSSLQRFVVRLGTPIGPAFPQLPRFYRNENNNRRRGRASGDNSHHSSSNIFSSGSFDDNVESSQDAADVDAQLVRSFLAGLDIFTVDNCVTQGDIFDALVRHLYGTELPTVVNAELRNLVVSRFQMHDIESERRRQFHVYAKPAGSGALGGPATGMRVKLCEAVSALIIQSRWRGAKIRKVVRSAMMGAQAAAARAQSPMLSGSGGGSLVQDPTLLHDASLPSRGVKSFALLAASGSFAPSASRRHAALSGSAGRGDDAGEAKDGAGSTVLGEAERERIKKEYLARRNQRGPHRRRGINEVL